MYRSLVLTVDPAWSPVSGADLRNWQNATAFSELGPVSLASLLPLTSTESRPNLDIEITALTLPGEKRRDAFNRKRTPVDPKIPQLAVSRLSALASEFRPYAIIVAGIGLRPLLPALRPFTRNLILARHAQYRVRSVCSGARLLGRAIGFHASSTVPRTTSENRACRNTDCGSCVGVFASGPKAIGLAHWEFSQIPPGSK